MREVYQATFLLAISAILLAIVVVSEELEAWAIVALIALHLWMLFLFAAEDLPSWRDWTMLWAVLIGLGYLLAFVLMPRTEGLEFFGFILFLGYLGSAVAIAIPPRIFERRIVEKEVEEFRKKDDLDELIDSFEISKAPEEEVIETSEPELDIEDTVEVYSSTHGKPAFSFETEQVVHPIDVSGLKKDVELMETEASKLSEKIKKISEAALSEPVVVKENAVFASKSGSKYHKARDCLSLKRAEEVITFDNSAEARKKGLRACGLCR